MKRAVIHGPNDLRLDEANEPLAGPDDVVIKLVAAGICGTDILHRAAGGVNGPAKSPMALGHEFAGKIIKVGSNVRSYKVGEHVAYNSYNSPADMGRGGECGAFSNYVVVRGVDSHQQSLLRVPANVSLEHAALVEPLAVATHAVNRADPKPGESVAIFGVGPIGLGMIMALQIRGVDDIVVFDLSKSRLQRALDIGAKAAFDPRRTPPQEALGKLRGYGTLWGSQYPITNVYLDTSGAPGILQEISDFCHLASRIVTVAIQKKPITLDSGVILRKELTIMGSLGYPTEFPQVMQQLADGLLKPEKLISHRYSFENFLSAFDKAADAEDSAKVLVQFP